MTTGKPQKNKGSKTISTISGRPDITAADVERFLLELADALNQSLDLDAVLNHTAELVRRVIPYEIFGILLLNDKTQLLRPRFTIGLPQEIQRLNLPLGYGITGQAALRRQAVCVGNVTLDPHYINAHPDVHSELALPLMARNKVIGVIDIQSKEADFFTLEHIRLLQLVASRIAVAIENARLYTRIYRQAKQLAVLNEISRELTSILNPDQLLQRIADLLKRLIDYQMFSILLLDSSEDVLKHRFSLRFNENIHLKHDIPIGRGLVGAAAKEKKAILVPDVSKDGRYIQVNPETRSELCIPLIYKDKVIGVMDIEHTRRNYFNEDHERTMTTLAAQVAIAIENARLVERTTREEHRLERDLAMAREIQRRMLPASCPVLEDAEIAASFRPAHAIGGDIYDFPSYSGGRTCIAVGDVSGKGAPAALFAAMVSGIIRSTAALELGPAEMLRAINVSLNERRIEAQFVSMIYAIWNQGTRTMQIANSGQPRPLHCRNGVVERVAATGVPLGLIEDITYDEILVQSEPGDVFVFFSDGIMDAVDKNGQQFGWNRIEEAVSKNHMHSAEKIVHAMDNAVRKFAHGVKPYDDETIVVFKIKNTIDASSQKRKKVRVVYKSS
jgi:sigma-B regulation protein RsbU (phosphoserine phosphatase)